MSFRFDDFSMSHMIRCGRALRACSEHASSMEEAARHMVNYIYEAFRYTDFEGEERNACALVRLFKTHSMMELEQEQRKFARGLLKGNYDPRGLRCLTMLASRGEKEAWNDRRLSRGHIAIPLPSREAISAFPMVTQIIKQLDLDLNSVIKADPDLYVKLGSKSCGVFHVPRAWGSPTIPDQDTFVIPHRIESVLGFGGVFPYGDIYTVILFSHVTITREVAERFQTLSLHAKMALLPFVGGSIFAPDLQKVGG